VTLTSGYAARAACYTAEIAGVVPPERLGSLLRPGLRVAEMPSGPGHFLPAYAAAGAEVVLIDACADMLTAAQRRTAGQQVSSLRTICCRIEDLPAGTGPADVVVIPNAALNQLAASTGPAELIAAAARLLVPGGVLLAQVLRVADDGRAGPCGFYDPALADGTWIADREFTGSDGLRVARRRQQHHGGTWLHIDFEFTRDGETLYDHRVDLRLLTNLQVQTAMADAGLTPAGTCPGADGLDVVLAAGVQASTR
jgi:SAM-dependent methyltransferase